MTRLSDLVPDLDDKDAVERARVLLEASPLRRRMPPSSTPTIRHSRWLPPLRTIAGPSTPSGRTGGRTTSEERPSSFRSPRS